MNHEQKSNRRLKQQLRSLTDNYINREKLKSHIEGDNNNAFVLRHKTERNNQEASKNLQEAEVMAKFKIELQ